MAPNTLTALTATLVLAVAFFAAGCNQTQQREMTMTQSDQLVSELGAVLAEAMRARADAGQPVPEDFEADTNAFAASVIESMLIQHPEAFAVTPQEDQRISRGDFDNEANATILSRLLDEAEAHDVRLSTIASYLKTQFEQEGLGGARLELAARLVTAELVAAREQDMPRFNDEAAEI